MIKRLSVVRRRTDLASEEFRDYWLGPHADLALELPGLKGYVVNLAIPSSLHTSDDAPDGIAEVWFDDVPSMEDAFMHPSFAPRLKADRDRFIGHMSTLLVEEHVLLARHVSS